MSTIEVLSPAEAFDRTLKPVQQLDINSLSDEDTQCPICHELAYKPMRLPCSCKQVYCNECIRRHLSQSDSCFPCTKKFFASSQDYAIQTLKDAVPDDWPVFAFLLSGLALGLTVVWFSARGLIKALISRGVVK